MKRGWKALATDKRLRLRDDLEYYARNCLKIRTKAGKVDPFVFNKAQLHIHSQLERQLAETGRVRARIAGRSVSVVTADSGSRGVPPT